MRVVSTPAEMMSLARWAAPRRDGIDLLVSAIDGLIPKGGAELGERPGSPAAQQRATLSAPPWDDEAVRYLVFPPTRLLSSMYDHLRGLAFAIQPECPLFVIPVLSRAVVEAAARSWWMLEPSRPLEEAVARRLNEVLRMNRELAARVPPAADPAVTIAAGRRYGLKELLDKGEVRWFEIARPRSTNVARQLFESMGAEGQLADLPYTVLSNILHSDMAVLMRIDAVEWSTDDNDRILRVAAGSCISAMRRYCDWVGERQLSSTTVDEIFRLLGGERSRLAEQE